MANTFWEKDFLIMCSYMSQSADCFMHSGFLLHIISNYALQTLCGSPHKVCDEEGKLTGKPLNRALRDEDGHICDAVAGTFLLTGLSEDSFSSLTPEQIKKFSEHYKTPEMFLQMNGRLMVLPMDGPIKRPEKTKKKHRRQER